RVAAERGIEAAGLDLAADGFALGGEARERHPAIETAAVQLDEPVESGPREHARVGVVPRPVAGFPDPLVGAAPVVADELAEIGEEAAGLAIDLAVVAGV